MTIKVERPDPISAPLKLGHVQQNAYVVKVESDMSTDWNNVFAAVKMPPGYFGGMRYPHENWGGIVLVDKRGAIIREHNSQRDGKPVINIARLEPVLRG